jgi:uncharacterized circularly permuted ATP-grasp superfamily protein
MRSTEEAAPELPAYDPDGFWDEMFAAPGRVRPHYAALAQHLAHLGPAAAGRHQRAAEASFLARGITFAVNQGPEGTEKIMPFDLVPRIITAAEWAHIEHGLEQRVRTINLFIRDVYNDQESLRDGVVPAELVLGAKSYRREMRGFEPPLGVYAHIVGTDLVRDASGEFFVLEDNARTPSGVSYLVENRRVLKHTWPQIFEGYDVRPVEGYPQDLLATLQEVAPPVADGRPVVVLLTPGIHNSAYFEHVFLAKGMGIPLVQGADLAVDEGAVFMHTTRGRQRVHVVYRRVDDDFLDPLAFRQDSLIGVPGLMAVYRMGGVTIVNAPGTGVADDKAVYAYIPALIRYFLGEEPILPNVKTFVLENPGDRAYVLQHLQELVVKSVNESGGYGMLIGPHSTAKERESFRRQIEANPRGFIAQPTLALSRHPSWVHDHFEGRHIDLRPFILSGARIRISPGGLTRVALKRGSLVVNSSQGGGGKDTWVLADGHDTEVDG